MISTNVNKNIVLIRNLSIIFVIQIERNMNIAHLYSIFLSCSEIITDSRSCKKNALFIALRGESFNGNAYAAIALSNGCAYALVDDKKYYNADDDRYLWTDDCLKTLQQLANYHRKQLNLPVLGITGTNGKTTTKELIAKVLASHYSVHYTQGNLNNHIGVPLTLLQLKPQHEFAIIEMGANHKGEIKELAEIAEPNYGLITNIGKAHIEGFGSIEGVKRTKEELYIFLSQQKNSLIFRFADDDNLKELSKNKDFNQITYGIEKEGDITGRVISLTPFLHFEWKRKDDSDYHQVDTQLIGSYNLPNFLAAVSIGLYFKIPSQDINQALSNYTPQNNRSQLKKTEKNTLIIDAYNANPTSMQASLKNFMELPQPHKIVILGAMGELGSISQEEHSKILNLVEKAHFEEVFLVGQNFKSLESKYPSYLTTEELIQHLQKHPLQNKTILIKGSRSVHLEKVLPIL